MNERLSKLIEDKRYWIRFKCLKVWSWQIHNIEQQEVLVKE